jgi:hypothetical protein
VSLSIEVLPLIRNFLRLQQILLEAFKSAYPNLHDWHLLLDFPKSGHIAVDGESWSFRKHGTGLIFTNFSGAVIDVPQYLESPDLFDSWRLLRYLESMLPEHRTITESELSTEMERLVRSGMLLRGNHECTFRLRPGLR